MDFLCMNTGDLAGAPTTQNADRFIDQLGLDEVVPLVTVDNTNGNSALDLFSDVGNLSGALAASHNEDVSKSGCSKPGGLQPKLLKQINALNTKEELLDYVARCHQLLDCINLVTILYRLARIYSITQASVQKTAWRADLFASSSFTLLLTSIQRHLLQGQAIVNTVQGEVPGLNARCMSNLIWSIVKLEITADDGHPLATEIVNSASPLVMVFLGDCSGQGLANLLWSFAKIHTSPPAVMTAIVKRVVDLLQDPAASSLLDVQALSNSIWAIAHVQTRSNEMETQDEWQEAVANFLLLMANQCLVLLHGIMEKPVMRRTLLSGIEMDSKVSCQAIANIAWSFATILGSACGVQDPVRPLFQLIRQLTVAKLSNSSTALAAKPIWAHTLAGTFNEQALANIVFAYEKANLLSSELLQVILDAACQKLCRASAGAANGQGQPNGPLGFKAQELVMLLGACYGGVAQPWTFLQTLSRVLAQYPMATSAWTSDELAELRKAMQLLRDHVPDHHVQAGPRGGSSQNSSGDLPQRSLQQHQTLNFLDQLQQQNIVRQRQTIPLALQGNANSFPIAATPATAAAANGAAAAAGQRRFILSSALNDQVQAAQQDVAVGCLSAPSLHVPVQQVWIRGADGQLQAATLLLPQSQSSSAGGGVAGQQQQHQFNLSAGDLRQTYAPQPTILAQNGAFMPSAGSHAIVSTPNSHASMLSQPTSQASLLQPGSQASIVTQHSMGQQQFQQALFGNAGHQSNLMRSSGSLNSQQQQALYAVASNMQAQGNISSQQQAMYAVTSSQAHQTQNLLAAAGLQQQSAAQQLHYLQQQQQKQQAHHVLGNAGGLLNSSGGSNASALMASINGNAGGAAGGLSLDNLALSSSAAAALQSQLANLNLQF